MIGKWAAILASSALGLAGACAATFAGPFDGRPKILLHVTAPTVKNICGRAQLADCLSANSSGSTVESPDGPFHFVYLLLDRGHLTSTRGFICGITYENMAAGAQNNGTGLDIFDWVSCGEGGELETIVPWPRPGSQILRYWSGDHDECYNAKVAVTGYFYVGAYGPDTLRITKPPDNKYIAVLDCFPQEDFILTTEDLGWATFSQGAAAPGCNPCVGPCGSTPVQPVTWGAIKSGRKAVLGEH